MLYKKVNLLLLFSLTCVFLSGCSVRPLYENDSSNGESSSIKVDMISNRDGQRLRSFLLDYLRDIQFTHEKMRLTTTLTLSEKSFAHDDSGYAHRLLSTYTAKVILRDKNKKIIMDKNISSSTTYNIAQAQGEMILSLYGKDNSALLKELARKIVENIKITLEMNE